MVNIISQDTVEEVDSHLKLEREWETGLEQFHHQFYYRAYSEVLWSSKAGKGRGHRGAAVSLPTL